MAMPKKSNPPARLYSCDYQALLSIELSPFLSKLLDRSFDLEIREAYKLILC